MTAPEPGDAPLTLLEAVRRAADFLGRRGVGNARLEAEILLAHVRSTDRLQVYLAFEDILLEPERTAYRQLVLERASGRPVAYLTGRREFYSRGFAVDGRVLVPRPETEHLVDEALRHCRGRDGPRVLDLGVGSGAILVTLAAELGSGVFVGTDVSADALAVAADNAQRLAPGADVRLLEGDLYGPLGTGRELPGAFDVIISNPPYIPAAEIDSLPCDVKDFEPRRALDSGADPFTFHRRILAEGRSRIAAEGAFILELPGRRDAVLEELARVIDPPVAVRVVRDWAGLDRVLVLSRAANPRS